MLQIEYLLAKIGFDTAENELLEVWGENPIQYSIESALLRVKPVGLAICKKANKRT